MNQFPDQQIMNSPMLAKGVDFNKLVYPVLCQPKLDGIRAVMNNGVALSRSMKKIPNTFIQHWALTHAEHLHGMDGELIVGNMLDPGAFQNTTSGVMTRHGEPDFTYYVFDMWDMQDYPAIAREEIYNHKVARATDVHKIERIKAVPTFVCHDGAQVKGVMDNLLEHGAEGLILRHQDAPYKYGRSTVNEGSLLKWKQFVDEEGIVEGFEELMHNENEQFVSETGHSKRSAHQANKVPGNMLGALIVSNPKYPGHLRVGSGFDIATRQEIWDNRPSYLGKLVKYKYFPIGMKDLPRHPIFLGFRHGDDQ